MRRAQQQALVLAAFSLAASLVGAHQHCHFGARNPAVGFNSEIGFCSNDDPEGFCCDAREENDVKSRYDLHSLRGDCASLHKEVLCSVCSPFSGHLYEKLTEKGLDGLTMTEDFCTKYVDECRDQISFEDDYCKAHTLDYSNEYWSYPYTAVLDFNTDGLSKAFPDLDKRYLPPLPMFMEMTPDGKFWWIAGIKGKIIQVEADNPSKVDDVVLDMTPIKSEMEVGFIVSKEEGLLGFALGPAFRGVGSPFYVSYTVNDGTLTGEPGEKAYNQLSKFTYMGNKKLTLASEEELIATDVKGSTIHQSGWLGFKPSAKHSPDNDKDDLYWAVGDGGPPFDPYNKAMDLNSLLGKIIRIRVPRAATNDPKNKIPLYENPPDNAKDEICSYGHRNPFRCGFDREGDLLYCADVGQVKIEEINLIECGQNYGWNRFEGDICLRENEWDEADLGSCENVDFDSYRSPFFQYCHPSYHSKSDDRIYTNGVDVCGDRSITGLAVIGGLVYRGNKYKDVLDGKYLFSDWQTTALHYVSNGEGGTMLKPVNGANPRVVHYAEDLDGEVYMVEYNGDIWHLPCGDLCDSTCLGEGVPPSYESKGCVKDSSGTRVFSHQAAACPAGQDAMSPDICASYCFNVPGATHFGLQYSFECFCGTDEEASHLTAADGQCTRLCEGNPEFVCGGFRAMEVFELGETIGDAPEGSVYLGCYSDGKERVMVKELSTDAMTIQLCSETCVKTANNVYFGIQYGKECHCSNGVVDPTMYGTTSCPMDCAGGDGKCGGRYATSLYQYSGSSPSDGLAPGSVEGAEYIGCFRDEGDDRIMTLAAITAGMNAQICAKTEACTGKRYIGLQFSTECWCGDGDVTRHGSAVCGMECGSGSGACGGRHAMTTYEHASGLTPEVVEGAEYRGCYKDPGDDRIMLLEEVNVDMTAMACSTKCKGTEYFGVQNSNECWCGGGDVDRHGPGVCDGKCEGGSGACGGRYAMTTYKYTSSGTEIGTYLGCFRDSKSLRVFTLESIAYPKLTPQVCMGYCRDAGGAFYGLQYGVECWCGKSTDDFEQHMTGDKPVCDKTCGGSTDSCGGSYALDVYRIGSSTSYSEVGCYKDRSNERIFTLIPEAPSDNSIKSCHDSCKKIHEASFFGMQYGIQCWCGRSTANYERHGVGTCDYACPGASAEICGGYNTMSVYRMDD